MKNIYIRPIEENDIEIIRQWRNQDDVRNNFINNYIISSEQQKKWYTNYLKNDKTDKMFLFYLEEEPIGCVALYNINQENKNAEFGRLMIGKEKHRKKGYAQNATYRICKYGFNTLELENIYLSVFGDNIKAAKLYEKLGFKSIGEEIVNERTLIQMNLNKFDLRKGE